MPHLPRFLFGLIACIIANNFAFANDGIIVKGLYEQSDIVCKKVCGEASKCELLSFSGNSNTIHCPGKGNAWVDNNGNDYETGKPVKFESESKSETPAKKSEPAPKSHTKKQEAPKTPEKPKEISDDQFDELADDLEKEAKESSAKARKNNSAERNAALEKREQKVNQAEQENKADIETCKKYCNGNGNCTIKNDILTCSSNGTQHNLNEVKNGKSEPAPKKAETPAKKSEPTPKRAASVSKEECEKSCASKTCRQISNNNDDYTCLKLNSGEYAFKSDCESKCSGDDKLCKSEKNSQKMWIYACKTLTPLAENEYTDETVCKEKCKDGKCRYSTHKERGHIYTCEQKNNNAQSDEQSELKKDFESDVQQIIDAYNKRKAELETENK